MEWTDERLAYEHFGMVLLTEVSGNFIREKLGCTVSDGKSELKLKVTCFVKKSRRCIVLLFSVNDDNNVRTLCVLFCANPQGGPM